MSTIHERLQKLIDYLAGGNQSEFGRTIGVTQATLNTYLIRHSEPGFSILYKIVMSYPAVSSEWLLTGSGAMFKEARPGNTQHNTITGNVGTLAAGNVHPLHTGQQLELALKREQELKEKLSILEEKYKKTKKLLRRMKKD